MTPKHIYDLPDLMMSVWYEMPDATATFLKDWADLDVRQGRDAGSHDLTLHRKISRSASSVNESVDYIVLSYRQTPFGILIQTGYGKNATHHRFVTDPNAYLAARKELLQFQKSDPEIVEVTAETAIDELNGVAGCVLIEYRGQMVLRPRTHFTRSGKLILDEDQFRSAFNNIVRPVFENLAPEEVARGIRSPLMQVLTRRAIVTAIAADCQTAVTFRPPRRDEPNPPDLAQILALPGHDPRCEWPGVLIKHDASTYLVGLQSSKIDSHFRWIDDLIVEHLGDADLFDTMRLETSPHQDSHDEND